MASPTQPPVRADPDPPDPDNVAGPRDAHRAPALRCRPLQGRDRLRPGPGRGDPVPDPQLAPEHAAVRQRAVITVLDLVDDGGQRAARRAGRGHQPRQRRQQAGDARPGQRRSRRHGHDGAAAHLGARGAQRHHLGHARPVQGGGEQPVVPRCQHVDGRRVRQRDRPGGRAGRPGGQHVRHGQQPRTGAGRQAAADPGQHPGRVRPLAVDLVDEDGGGHAQAPQHPPQDHGLRLHSLHRGYDQDGRVQDGQAALDLGDEVGVARGVDEIDLHAARGEGRDVGAHGDAAAPLDVHRVGAGRARVDAAELGGGARLEQQPFGQAGLARVNMGQDSEIDGAHETAAPGVGSGRSAEQLPHPSRYLLKKAVQRTVH